MASVSNSVQAFEYVWWRDGKKSDHYPLGTISCSVACVKDPAPGEATSTKVKVLDIHKDERTSTPPSKFGRNHLKYSWPVHTGFITSRTGYCPRVCLSYAEHKEKGEQDVETQSGWHHGYDHDLYIRVYLDGSTVPEVITRIPHDAEGNKETIELYRIDSETGLHRPFNWQDHGLIADTGAGQRRPGRPKGSTAALIKEADSTSSIRVALSMEHSWKDYSTVPSTTASPQIVQGPADETLESAKGRRCTHNLVEAYSRAPPPKPVSDSEEGPIEPKEGCAELPLVEFIFYYKSKKKLEELGIRQKEQQGSADNKRPAAAPLPSQPSAKRSAPAVPNRTGMTERQQMAALRKEQEMDRATSAPLPHFQSATSAPLPHLQPAKIVTIPHFQPASSAPPSSLQSQPSHVKAPRPPLRPSSSTLPSFKKKSAPLQPLQPELQIPLASTSTASVESLVQQFLEKSMSPVSPPCPDATTTEQAKNEGQAAENAALDDASSVGMQVDSTLDMSVQSGAGSRRTSIFSHTSRSTARTSPFPKQESPEPEAMQDKTDAADGLANDSAASAGIGIDAIEISDDDEDDAPLLGRCGLLAAGLPSSPKVKSEPNDTAGNTAVAAGNTFLVATAKTAVVVKTEEREAVVPAFSNTDIPPPGESAHTTQASLGASSQIVAEADDEVEIARFDAVQVVARIFAEDQAPINAIGALRKLGLVATVEDYISKQKSLSPAWKSFLAGQALEGLTGAGWDLTSAVQVLSMLKMSTPEKD